MAFESETMKEVTAALDLIFGYSRHSRISARCTRENPKDRYRTVSDISRALRCRRLMPFVAAALPVFLAIIAIATSQQHGLSALQQAEQQRIETAAVRDSAIVLLKSKVDEWYATTADSARIRMAGEPDIRKRSSIFGDMIDDYNRLCSELLELNPEMYNSPDFQSYLGIRFNEDLPQPY